jgi:hypothetical protein
MAVIIFHSKEVLAERHKAWQWIVDTQTDMEVLEWADSNNDKLLYKSLHQFLINYMKVENSLVNRLKVEEPNTIYTYSVRYNYENPTDDFYDVDHYRTPYSLYDLVFEVIKSKSEENAKLLDYSNRIFRIYKRFFDMDRKCLFVDVTPDGQVISNWEGEREFLDEVEYDILSSFYLINIYVPVPFEKGDILSYAYGRPFVLASDEWKYGKNKNPEKKLYLAEGSTMDTVYSYIVEENGFVAFDFSPATLDLRYFRKELLGIDRVLRTISNHLKDEISLELMMNAYNIILHEEQLNNIQNNMREYTDYGLSLVGLHKTGTAQTIIKQAGMENKWFVSSTNNFHDDDTIYARQNRVFFTRKHTQKPSENDSSDVRVLMIEDCDEWLENGKLIKSSVLTMGCVGKGWLGSEIPTEEINIKNMTRDNVIDTAVNYFLRAESSYIKNKCCD